jgi:hypothetical protein
LEENLAQKQKHFINQNKKLTQEKDLAVKAQTEIEENCKEKMDKYDEIMADINLKLLEKDKLIGMHLNLIIHMSQMLKLFCR